MASVDAGQYSLSSDEKVEFECSPCKDDGMVREAKYFCPECSEYFCSSCESSLHGRLKATKSHKLLSASDGHKTVTQKTAKLPIMTCGCNRDTSVEFICDEHKCLVCSECKVISHRKCKTDAIVEKSKSFNQEVVKSLLQQAKSLEDKANHLCAEHSKNLETFEASKSKCRVEIIQIRDQLVRLVENLAKEALDKLDAISVDNPETPSTDLSACKSVTEKLKREQQLLQDVLASGETQQLFIADFLLSEAFENYNCLLEEIKKEMNITSLVFLVDTKILDIQSNFKRLGDIFVNIPSSGSKHFPLSLLPMKPFKMDKFDVTPPGAKRMTGSTFMPNGELIVCDFDAEMLRIFDHDFKEKHILTVSARPFDAAVVSEKEIIVTLPLSKQLQVVSVAPTLKLGSKINVRKKCFDVDMVGSNIYVVCTNDPGEGEVRVIDWDGNVKKRLGMYEDGTCLFSHPLHMSVNHDQNKVYVSDWSTHTVFCLSMEGNVLYKLYN